MCLWYHRDNLSITSLIAKRICDGVERHSWILLSYFLTVKKVILS